jgi:ADP-L-glycero-D-manno-heptose 6-epimerase
MRQERVLITGGGGFIGSAIARALGQTGRPVVIADTFGSAASAKWKNLQHVAIDEIVSPDALECWCRDQSRSLGAIIHMGAISSTTEDDVDLIMHTNFELSRRLWQIAVDGQIPYIYASSAAVYGDGSSGFDEAVDPGLLKPLNAYGWSKLQFDWFTLRAAQKPAQWAGLRFFNVYGPGEGHKGGMRSMVRQIAEQAMSAGTVRLFRSYRPDIADGEQLRDFIHVQDCVRVVIWLLANPGISGIFNVGSGEASSFNQIAHHVFKILEVEPRIDYIDMPESIRDAYQYRTVAPLGKLSATGMDAPMIGASMGLRSYVGTIMKGERGDVAPKI